MPPKTAPETTETKVVYATSTLMLIDTPDGRPAFKINRGEQWAADDPVVKHRPDLFTDDATAIHRSTRMETVGGVVGGAPRPVRIPR